MDILRSGLVAMIATLFCVWLLSPLARHIGFVDRPGGRKFHDYDTPLIGGVAMFFGFCFSLLALQESLQSYRGLIAGSSLLVLMGVVDDFKELSPKLRLMGQLAAALCLTAWGNKLVSHLGSLFFLGNITLGMWSLPMTVFCIIGFINAMNMLDGQDGLAGGVALTQVALLLFLAFHHRLYDDIHILVLVAVLLFVFLGFNMRTPWRRKASIFMGDSGITFVSFVIAWFTIDLAQSSDKIQPIVALWILAFPLFDLIAVCIYRFAQGKSILHAGRDHFHHILHLVPVNVRTSTFLLCALSFTLGGIGVLMNDWLLPAGWQLLFFLIVLIAYLILFKYVLHLVSKASLDCKMIKQESKSEYG